MNWFIHIARPYIAWSLLLTIGYQQLVGRIYVRNVYFEEIEARMNDKEAAIARQLRSTTGIETYVEVEKDQSGADLDRVGYGAPIVFLREVDGEIYHFTIGKEAIRIVQESYVPGRQNTPLEVPKSQTLLNKLFPDFYFDVTGLTCKTSPLANNARVFEVSDGLLDFKPAIPLPPPRWI